MNSARTPTAEQILHATERAKAMAATCPVRVEVRRGAYELLKRHFLPREPDWLGSNLDGLPIVLVDDGDLPDHDYAVVFFDGRREAREFRPKRGGGR